MLGVGWDSGVAPPRLLGADNMLFASLLENKSTVFKSLRCMACFALAGVGAVPLQRPVQRSDSFCYFDELYELTIASQLQDDTRERVELQRCYYALLLAVALNGLASALAGLAPQALEQTMAALLQGASRHVDPAVRKTCIQARRHGMLSAQ